MKVSTKGRYALRMLIYLAEMPKGEFIPLKDIAEKQEISKKYLEQIVPILNRGDMLQTNRGYQGGYRLARDPADYTVGEILRATEGGLIPVACLGNNPKGCSRVESCETFYIWEGLEDTINTYLDNISLEDILKKKRGSSDLDLGLEG